jgi:hypothetical protein
MNGRAVAALLRREKWLAAASSAWCISAETRGASATSAAMSGGVRSLENGSAAQW